MIANLLLVVASMLSGWAALYPMRHRLGPVMYHASAVPVGLAGWVLPAALAASAGTPMSWMVTIAGQALFVTAMFAISAHFTAGDERAAPTLRGYAAGGGAVLLPSAAVVAARFTAVGYDSYMHYEATAVWLRETGVLSPVLMGERNVLLPAFHAVVRLFGGDWTYAIYTVLALHCLVLLYLAVRGSAAALPSAAREGVAICSVALMAAMPAFVFHAFFVHSHMVTASYLLLAVYALSRSSAAREKAEEASWAILAGIGAAGIALARPDGPAYLLVPLAVLLVLTLGGRVSSRSLLAFSAPVALLVTPPFAAALATEGLWTSGKLGGKMALAVFGAEATMALVVLGLSLLMERRDSLARFREGWLRTAVLANVGVLAVAAFRFSLVFLRAIQPMTRNLMRDGRYGFFWYFAALVVAMVLMLGRRAWSRAEVRLVLYALGQFFAMALLVHAFTHPGRLGWGDSFNRVAFHAVPMVFWLAGVVAATLLESPVIERRALTR